MKMSAKKKRSLEKICIEIKKQKNCISFEVEKISGFDRKFSF
jgi:hypothetical protein